MENTQEISIKYTATKSLNVSVWSFDRPWLVAGETATVFGWYTAGENPLYKVRRDRDGDTRAIYRDLMIKSGSFE